MSDDTLPPLPAPVLERHEYEAWGQNMLGDFFSAGQMHAYARAAVSAALAQQQAEPCVSVSRLASMTEPLDGLEKSQPGYHWKRGWNDALRRAMDYAASPTEFGSAT